MQLRGRVQEGVVADLTLFDFAKVTDKGGEGGLPSTGIPYVIVNGTIMVKDSKVQKDVYPGQPIRFPVEEEGRFKSLSEKNGVGPFRPPISTLMRQTP